jgi:type IV secretion system protein VirB4
MSLHEKFYRYVLGAETIAETVDQLIPYRCFGRDPNEIDVRGTGMMLGFSMQGPSPETETPTTRLALAQQVTAAFTRLGTGDTIDIIFNRLQAEEPPPRSYPSEAARLIDQEHRERFRAANYWVNRTSLFLTHHYEHLAWRYFHELLFSVHRATSTTDQARQRARQHFASFHDAIGDELNIKPFTSAAMLRELNLIINGIDMPILIPEESIRLNHVLANQYQVNGGDPRIGQIYQRPISIDIYPTYTFPQMLAALLQEKGDMMLACRFICRDPYDTQEDLRRKRVHWGQADLGKWSDIFFRAAGWQQVIKRNEHAREMSRELDEEVIPAANAGMPMGFARITAIIRDKDATRCEDRTHDTVKNMNRLGITARIEDVYAAELIEETWPGNPTTSVRKPNSGPRQPNVKGSTFVNFALPLDRWPGSDFIDCEFFDQQPPAPFIGAGNFNFPTHDDGVGNQVWFGPIGAGKSAMMGNLVSGLTAIPEARIFWLDLDYSSFILSHLLDADYHDVGSEDSPGINPLVMLDEPNGHQWLLDWFIRIFARWQIDLKADQIDNLANALYNAKKNGDRSLRNIQGYIYSDYQNLKWVLLRYSQGGYYGHVFDHPGSNLEVGNNQLSVFEVRRLRDLGKKAAAPALEIILHRIINSMDGCPVWVFFDEFWNFLGDETSAEFLFDAIRSIRKRGGCFVGATQSTTEVVNSPLCNLLLQNCPGKIFFPNAELRSGNARVRDEYRQLGLPEHLITLIGSARRKAQFLYRNTEHSRLVTLRLGSVAKKICGATNWKNVREFREQLLAHPNNGDLLSSWLAR